VFDLFTDSGLGDSALRDYTSASEPTSEVLFKPEVLSRPLDDVSATSFKTIDFQPIAAEPVTTTASVPLSRDQIISASAAVARDVSETRSNEKLQSGCCDMSALLSTTTTSPLPQQPQDNFQQMHCGVAHPQIITRESPQLTEGSRGGENQSELELIHGGFGVKNPLLSRATDATNNSPTTSRLNTETVGK